MTFDADLVAKLVAPTIAAIITISIKAYSNAKPKVVAWIGHVSVFRLDTASRLQVVQLTGGDGQTREQHRSLHAHSYVVRNSGRKSATDVRLSHLILPDHVSVYPPVNYTIEKNPEGASDIIFPVLVPYEQVTVSYLYDPTLSYNLINAGIKSAEGLGRIVEAPSLQRAAPWRIGLVLVLAFIGLSLTIYWAVLGVIGLLQIGGSS